MGEANLTSAVAPPSAAPPPSLPSIPGYRPVALLGSGGMASVWMAERRFDDDGETATERRWCALKVTHPYVVDEDVVQGRFRREAQVASMLRHPNIAGVWRSGVFGRQLYLEMELIGGVSLASLLSRMRERDAPVPQGLLWQLNDEVLSALAYAHELRGADGQSLGVVHRDLSPSNVLIGFDGRARIIDFGMVRACLGGFQTMLGQIGGTPRYMSPEQA
ncbi:MAG: serine/threonine-protein kinase, partial [Myxococcota bacterium]